jgi:hypothetical protein
MIIQWIETMCDFINELPHDGKLTITMEVPGERFSGIIEELKPYTNQNDDIEDEVLVNYMEVSFLFKKIEE